MDLMELWNEVIRGLDEMHHSFSQFLFIGHFHSFDSSITQFAGFCLVWTDRLADCHGADAGSHHYSY